MRNKSARVALIAGLVLALTPGVALAASTGLARVRDAAPTSPTLAGPLAIRDVDGGHSTVTLPTGEQVTVTGAPGQERVAFGPLSSGSALVTRRVGEHLYVTPVAAEAYLGQFLDPALFDVLRLAAAKNEREPVRISYRGQAPTPKGITITSSAGGSAAGYLTRLSSRAFGQALTAEWRADQRAGGSRRSSLFDGVTKIQAAVPGSNRTAAAAVAPTFSLLVKAIGSDGLPLSSGQFTIMNVDDGSKLAARLSIQDGEARVDVPKGTYSLIGEEWTYNAETRIDTGRVTSVDDVKVTGAGQTVTLDHRTATVEPAVAVPKPVALGSYAFDWRRGDALGQNWAGTSYRLGSDFRLLMAPSSPVKVGKLKITQLWTLAEPVAVPSYTYNVGARTDQFPARSAYTFTAADLATVKDTYYGEGGPARTTGVLRYPTPGVLTGDYQLVSRGSRRTSYVGFTGAKAAWVDVLIVDYNAPEARTFFDGPPRTYAAGSTTAVDWFKGPLGAVIPRQIAFGEAALRCSGCRSGRDLDLAFVPFADSDLSHGSGIFPVWGKPVSRLRLYKDGKLRVDENDVFQDTFSVPKGKAKYKVVFDVDRRLSRPNQSTRTQTVMTFISSATTGKVLPKTWQCSGGWGDNCRVLPIVQARLSMPVSLDGTLPAGRSTVVVAVAPVQNAAASAAASATLEIRPAGMAWTTVKLKAIGGSKYQGVINNTKLAGLNVDVRFTGANKAGSTFRQTVLKAYTVAPN